ncbi:hypothetical protein JF737_22610, partial [Mycobacterium avium]
MVFSVVTRWIASWGPFGFQVADAAEQLADPCPLGHDLVVRGLERVLGVGRTFAPARRTGVVLLVLEAVSFGGGLPDGFGDSGFRVRVGVEEGRGDVGSTRDRGNGGRCLVPPESSDRLVHALERGLGIAAAGGKCCGGAWLGSVGRCGHAQVSSSSMSLVSFALRLVSLSVGVAGADDG